MHRSLALATAALSAGLLLSGCGSASSPAASPEPSAALSGTVNVFAAASLKEAFTKLGQQFQTTHPGVKIVFNFGPSSSLATQIKEGAPADVFASASPKNMGQVVAAGAASSPKNFASNVMEVAVPTQNPAHITALSDLAKPEVKVALCQSEAPCGATAAKVFTNAKLTVKPVTQELDVKAVLTKVIRGEVDAGIVYVTDVRAAGAKVKGIQIPADLNASTKYPIATLTKAANKAGAGAFTDYVSSTEGAKVLSADGFAKP
jgi:molybdate transport system substrate-binding protein